MRVLHITSTFFPDSNGGIEEVIRQICFNSKNFGVESRVFTLSDNPNPEIFIKEGIKVIRANKNFEIASSGFSFNAFLKFKKQVEWADIIHYHFPWPFADLLHLFCQVNKKSIITYHSDVVRQKKLKVLYTPLMSYFLYKVDRIVATSSNYADSSKVLKKYNDKVVIIPIGLNDDIFPYVDDTDLEIMKSKVGQNFFLFIGSLRKYKGLNVLLDAIYSTNLKCVIAGSGAEEINLIEQSKKLKLSNVQFLKQVNDKEKVALLKLCRAVVFSSVLRSEAFGVSLVEGSIFSKPLISTSLGTGTSYVNLHGNTGIEVPPSNSKALRDAMIQLNDNEELSNKMGSAARLRYEELFTGQLMGQKYVELYESLTN
jgi:glycosyltransferase involved in cell wall biosynthesis